MAIGLLPDASRNRRLDSVNGRSEIVVVIPALNEEGDTGPLPPAHRNQQNQRDCIGNDQSGVENPVRDCEVWPAETRSDAARRMNSTRFSDPISGTAGRGNPAPPRFVFFGMNQP